MFLEILKNKKISVADFDLIKIPVNIENAKTIYDIFLDDIDTFKYWFDGGMWKSEDEVLKYYQDKEQDNDSRWKTVMFGIYKNDELLGEIGLTGVDIKNKTGEIGYWLKKSARGMRIIDKLIPIIEEIGFKYLNLRKLNIWCDYDNIASRKHAEKNNYVLEGIQRERKLWPDGSVHSTAMFGKLKSEWKR